MEDSIVKQQRKMSDLEFLYSIVGLGESSETDVSKRDEEILAAEIDPIRGWGVKIEETKPKSNG